MQRLKTRAQFQAALATGPVSKTPHFALHRAPLQGLAASGRPLFAVPDVWLGAMAPKRWARRAVTRNTIKRQIYAVAGPFAPRLPQAAHVVRLRSAFDREQFVSATSVPLRRAVRQELLTLFERACTPARPAAQPYKAQPDTPAAAVQAAAAPAAFEQKTALRHVFPTEFTMKDIA